MNELKVSLENIIPLTEARDHFSQIVTEVQQDKLYVLTKGGKPAVAIIDVKYLEQLTGGEISKKNIVQEIKKAPEKVGLAPMIEHPVTPQASHPAPLPTVAPPPTPPVSPVSPPSLTPPAPRPPVNPPKPASPTPPPPAPIAPPPVSPTSTSSSNTDSKIDVQFTPDNDSKNQNKSNQPLAPDDKVGKAQYAGDKDEAEDMAID